MDFGELNIDGLIHTGALSSAIPEADLRKIRLLAPHTILNEGPPPEFQNMVANGQLEAPIATVELQFEVGDITFREKFIVMTNLTSPLIGLLFLQRNNTILDMRQGILNFPFFSMQLKNEDRTYPNVIEHILNPAETILQPGKRTTIWVKSQIYTDNEATGIIQPSPLLENGEDLLICPALSSTQNNKHMVQIINFPDHPYTLKKGTHISNFSILTHEQTKHIRPVNPTTVRHLLNNSHDDAIHYINKPLKTIIRKLHGRLTIISLSHKMTYTQLHGKQNLVDTYLISLSYTLTQTQLILMIVTHRDQILLLSHVPIFMIQTMVKTGKHAPFLTHLYHKI